MSCFKCKNGKCEAFDLACDGRNSLKDCFVELECDPATEKTENEKLVERIEQALTKIDQVMIGNTSLKSDFLQLKKDVDTLRNRCNNALGAASAIGIFESIIAQLAENQGYEIVKTESEMVLKKKPVKRAVKKAIEKSVKKPVKKVVKKR